METSTKSRADDKALGQEKPENRLMNTSNTQRKTAIKLENISLRIPVAIDGNKKTLKNSIVSAVTGGIIKRKGNQSWVEALKNISLTIEQGERIALIGHNGAGKTTFLRLISGIYEPTKGKLKSYCNVYPMLQKNFLTSPELSGVEAVKAQYLLLHGNLKKFDHFLQEICEFSELDEFIHMPIKTYSEGMAARLLFTLLTSSRHEFLALDEGFGTGDARFYERASKRLEKFIDSSGTLVLASHSEELLQRFCTKGLVFNKGEITFSGKLNQALDYYHGTYS